MLGIGNEVNYLGSDFNAFIDRTRNAVIIEDDEYVILSRDTYIVKNIYSREEVTKSSTKIDWDSETSKKGGYPHYMLKEIYEQPQTVNNVLDVDEKNLNDIVNMVYKSENGFLVGVGTTYYVAEYGKYIFSSLAKEFMPAAAVCLFLLRT